MKAKSVFQAAPVRDPMGKPKNALNESGFASMQAALAGRRKNKPMKPPKMRERTTMNFAKKAP